MLLLLSFVSVVHIIKMNFSFKLLLFIAINFNQFSNQLGNQYCQETKVHNKVVWHESELSETCLVSEPLCLDSMKTIVTRNCTDAGWVPPDDEIGCNSYQAEFKFVAYCPSGYVEIYNTGICILIFKQQVWSADCVQHGSLSDIRDAIQTDPRIVKFLKISGIDKFWLPVKRDNNTEYLKWKMPSSLWNTPIEYDVNVLPIDNNGNCLSMNVELVESIEKCESKLSLVCLFDKNTESIVMKSFCTGSSVSARLTNYRETCFIVKPITDDENINTLALIDTEDKYFVIQSVIRDFNIEKSPVLVDLIPGQNGEFNTFDWSKSLDDISFIDWDAGLDREKIVDSSYDQDLYTVVWNEKWNLVNRELLEYQIIEDKYNFDDFPTITIYYNSTYDGLDVSIMHEARLWRTDHIMLACSFSGNAVEPTVKFDKIERVSNQWKLSLPYFKGNARYWCESVTLNDLVVVKSNVLEVQRNIFNSELIYSVLIEMPCGKCQFYGELNEIQNFTNHMTNMMQESDDFDDVIWQIKKIINFNPNNGTETILFHCIMRNIHDYSRSVAHDVFSYVLDNILDEMSYGARLIYVRDIDTCFSQNTDFPDTMIDHPSVYKKPCALENFLPPIQHCAGDLIEGAFWKNTYNDTDLTCTDEISNLSSYLSKLNAELDRLHSMNISTMLTELSDSVSENFFDTPASVHYTTEKLQNIMNLPNAVIFDSTPSNTFTVNPLNTVSEIIDMVINKNQSILQKAQSEMNTTNIMLETIDEMARKYSNSKSSDVDLKFSSDGTVLVIKRSLIVMISNPLIKNVTGIAIYRKMPNAVDENFDNYSIRKLFGHETYENIYNDTLEIGVNIPFKTLEQINVIRGGILAPVDRIVFKLFHSDSFFQESHENDSTEILKAHSKIIGITIPEYQGDHLPPGVFIIVAKKVHEINRRHFGCSDWTMDSTKSGWNKIYERSKMLNNYAVLCQVTRLRNYGFVQLFGNSLVTIEPAENQNYDQDIIFIITITGCILSLLGIFVIFTTAALIKTWRKREATPLILNICTATGLQLICYLLAETSIFHQYTLCLIIGGSLHYVTIVGFFLSLFVSNLQYRRYIIIIGPSIPKYFKTRLLVFGWVVPLLIVIVSICISPESYTPNEDVLNLGGICFPNGAVLLYTVHIPVIQIFCINLSVYIWIIIKLNTERSNLRKTPTRSNITKQIFLFAYTFFLLSLTWIFGLLAHFLNVNLFSYLFVITSTLQGFFIFLYCVIFDSTLRQIFKSIKL